MTKSEIQQVAEAAAKAVAESRPEPPAPVAITAAPAPNNIANSFKLPDGWVILAIFGLIAFFGQYFFDQFDSSKSEGTEAKQHRVIMQKEIDDNARAMSEIKENQAKNSSSMAEMKAGQVAIEGALVTLNASVKVLSEKTDKRYTSDDADKDNGILQRQLDAHEKELDDRGEWIESSDDTIRDILSRLQRIEDERD